MSTRATNSIDVNEALRLYHVWRNWREVANRLIRPNGQRLSDAIRLQRRPQIRPTGHRMTEPLAFRATYSDWKLVKTRGVVQIVMEVPIAEYRAALDVLGGMPDPGRENWFAVAPLKTPQTEKEIEPSNSRATLQPEETDKPRMAGAKRDWRAVPKPQQAGIRINEPTFAAYLREEHAHDWREAGDPDGCIKFMCGINSKRELATNARAGALWFQIDSSYQAWLAKERVGA
jgi:hypothetical protein